MPIINGDPDNLEGKVTICTDLFESRSRPPISRGIFASTELYDIANFLYGSDMKSKIIEEIFRKVKKRYDKKSNTIINFYSVSARFNDEILGLTVGDVIGVGDSYDEKEANEMLGETFVDYTLDYVNQNLPNAEITGVDRRVYRLSFKDNEKCYIFVTKYIIPFDHYNNHHEYAMKDVILDDYIIPLRKSVDNWNFGMMKKIKKRLWHFMENPDTKQRIDSKGDIDDIMYTLLKDKKNKDELIDLYLDKFVALNYELYEDAAKLRDKINNLKST